ncbi:hypothetical protein MWH06_01515 [Wolbachia pipientis]|nr:hypothetical protein MWH06_01515 [Wolbachia pipientis]
MTVNILKNDSLIGANKKGYNDSEEGFWDTTKGVAGANWQYVCHHPYKTAATFVAIAAAISLTAAYFLSPAYAAFVGTVGIKAATLVSPAITAVSAFLVAHPLFASLIVVAVVAALIAVPVLAYKNNSKADQINKVEEEILKVCEKDGDKPKVNDGKLKINGDASTFLINIAKVVELVPKEAAKTAQ